MKIFILSLGLLYSTLLSAGEWKTAEDMPTPRQEVYAAWTKDHIYIPGGVTSDSSGTTAAFEAYDTRTGTWQSLAPLPEPRHHITPAIIGNLLYAMGGFDGPFPQWVLKADTFVYDISRNSWRKGTPLPAPLGEHVALVVNNKIHVIGGRVRDKQGDNHFDAYLDTSDHYIYDPDADSWSKGAPAPTARNSAAAAVIDGLIYVVGGRYNEVQEDGRQLQKNLGTLEVYDPGTDSWQARAAMPEASGGNSAAALNGKLYVFGGEQWSPTQKVFASAWVYDPNTDQWQAETDMPTARHGLAAAMAGDTIVVIGGCTKTGGGAEVGITEILRP